MLDWHSCQICYPLEIKILLLLLLLRHKIKLITMMKQRQVLFANPKPTASQR